MNTYYRVSNKGVVVGPNESTASKKVIKRKRIRNIYLTPAC